MLENINDYISFIVLIIISIIAIRLFIGALVYKDDSIKSKRKSIIFDYSDNEDE